MRVWVIHKKRTSFLSYWIWFPTKAAAKAFADAQGDDPKKYTIAQLVTQQEMMQP